MLTDLDPKVQAAFKALAPEIYSTMGDGWDVYINSLTDSEIQHVLRLIHIVRKAIGDIY
jgi:hypothetical protein